MLILQNAINNLKFLEESSNLSAKENELIKYIIHDCMLTQEMIDSFSMNNELDKVKHALHIEEKKVKKLEEQLNTKDEVIEDLNKMLASRQRTIDILERKLDEERIKNYESSCAMYKESKPVEEDDDSIGETIACWFLILLIVAGFAMGLVSVITLYNAGLA